MRMPCVLLALSSMLLQAHARPPGQQEEWFVPAGSGSFSAAARNICTPPSGGVGDGNIWSPDLRRRVAIRPTPDGETALFAIDEHGRETAIDTAAWPCPEIGWSADSALFFVSYSDGGAVGTFHVSAYRIAAGKTVKIDIASAVRRDFQRRYPACFAPETPNVAGIAWSKSAVTVLVAAQVLPHANCDNMGTFALYEVAVPSGKILRRIPQLAAKASFRRLLGPGLRAAEDACFVQPADCSIPALHARP